MTGDELEKKLIVSKEADAFAEAELKESMDKVAEAKPKHLVDDDWVIL